MEKDSQVFSFRRRVVIATRSEVRTITTHKAASRSVVVKESHENRYGKHVSESLSLRGRSLEAGKYQIEAGNKGVRSSESEGRARRGKRKSSRDKNERALLPNESSSANVEKRKNSEYARSPSFSSSKNDQNTVERTLENQKEGRKKHDNSSFGIVLF